MCFSSPRFSVSQSISNVPPLHVSVLVANKQLARSMALDTLLWGNRP